MIPCSQPAYHQDEEVLSFNGEVREKSTEYQATARRPTASGSDRKYSQALESLAVQPLGLGQVVALAAPLVRRLYERLGESTAAGGGIIMGRGGGGISRDASAPPPPLDPTAPAAAAEGGVTALAANTGVADAAASATAPAPLDRGGGTAGTLLLPPTVAAAVAVTGAFTLNLSLRTGTGIMVRPAA